MNLDETTPVPPASDDLIHLLLGSGETYLAQGDVDSARRCATHALTLAGAGPPSSACAAAESFPRALRLLGKIHTAGGDLNEAARRFEESLRIEDERQDQIACASVLCDLADIARRRNDPDLARRLLLESLRRSSASAPGAVRARALEELGAIHGIRADYEEALDCFHEALRIFEGLDDLPAQARDLNRIGNLLQKLGRPAEALENQRRSLRIWESLRNGLETAKALNNIGGGLMRQGDYDGAMNCFETACGHFRELGERRMLAHVLSNIGLLHNYKGDTRQAEAILKESLDISEGLEDRQGQANCLNNLAHMAIMAGRYEDAIDWSKRSVAIRLLLQQQEGMAQPWINLAWAYMELGRYADAQEAARNVSELAEKSGSTETQVESWILDAALSLRREGPAKAMDRARSACDAASREGYRLHHGQALQILGEACLALEDHDGARSSLLEAEGIFRDLRAHLSLASTRLALGQLFHRIGLPEAAAERLRRAAEELDRMGNDPLRLRALLILAEAESRVSPAQARTTLDAARRIAQRLDRPELEEQVEEASRSIAGWTGGGGGRGAARAADLIRDVAALLRKQGSHPEELEAVLRLLADRLDLSFAMLRLDGREPLGPIPPGSGTPPQAADSWRIPVLDRTSRSRGVLVACGPDGEDRTGDNEERRSLLEAAAGMLGLALPAGTDTEDGAARPIPRSAGDPRGGRSTFEGIVGAGATMQEIFAAIEKVAPSDASVLIQGESGTGKELVARAIHARSRRAAGPFVAISCPSIPRELIEAELFGHERGAFTGAHTARPGRIEAADRGTLFLDEIGDMALATQSKLLRFLQERELQRVGGRALLRVDVRLVAATSRNLDEEIRRGRFREDLFYRVSVVPVRLPALRDRIEDLPLLVEHFLQMLSAKKGRAQAPPRLSEEAMEILRFYPWPGNVRELQNVMEYLMTMGHGQGSQIDAGQLPVKLRREAARESSVRRHAPRTEAEEPALRSGETLDARLFSLEGELIRGALERSGWNQSQAARMLGITETRLRHRMRRYGIRQERKRQ